MINDGLVERINALRGILNDATLDVVSATDYTMKLKKDIDKFITKYHQNSISYRADKNLWQTKVSPGRTRITAKNLDDLKMKLFEYYTEQEEKKRTYTLENLYPKWIEEKKGLMSSETVDHNIQDWNKYLVGTDISKMNIKSITGSVWSDFSMKLVGNGKIKQRCYSNIKSVVFGILDYAVRQNEIPYDYNILRNGVKLNLNFAEETGHEDSPEDAFTQEEKELIFSYLLKHINDESDDIKYSCALIIQMSTGIRVGELKALHWSDYNEKDNTLYIHRSIVYRKVFDEALGRDVKRPTELSRTKGKKKEANRVLPLTENAITALKKLKGLSEGSEYIITNSAGNTIDTNKYNKWVARYCKESGIRKHSSHDSRRYAISALLDSGVPLETVKTYAGHLETSTTASYFRRIQDKKYCEAFKNALS